MKNRIATGRVRAGQGGAGSRSIDAARRSTCFRRIPVAEGCVLLMLGLAGAAHAQGAAAASPAASAASAAEDRQQVVVTGIRRGIEDAISTKKNSSSIVEAISSEDIGKLPDNTVAESLTRLTGVTVQRNKTNGKATAVSVRGMSPSFNGSLLNGREQASTSDARSPEFDLFPSELTGSVVVYKTPDASLMGQGLASTIDLHTLRPLDFHERTIVANYKREKIGVDSGSQPGYGHRTTLSYVDQFLDRTVGVSLGLTSFKEDNGGELVFDNWGGYAPQVDFNGAQVTVPGGFLFDTQHRKSERDGLSLTLAVEAERQVQDDDRHLLFARPRVDEEDRPRRRDPVRHRPVRPERRAQQRDRRRRRGDQRHDQQLQGRRPQPHVLEQGSLPVAGLERRPEAVGHVARRGRRGALARRQGAEQLRDDRRPAGQHARGPARLDLVDRLQRHQLLAGQVHAQPATTPTAASPC